MNDISADELYERLLAYGLFADKLPPILSSVDFYHYCQNKAPSFSDSWKQYIYYESVRNINVPRPLAIHWLFLTPWLIKSCAVVFQITGII